MYIYFTDEITIFNKNIENISRNNEDKQLGWVFINIIHLYLIYNSKKIEYYPANKLNIFVLNNTC